MSALPIHKVEKYRTLVQHNKTMKCGISISLDWGIQRVQHYKHVLQIDLMGSVLSILKSQANRVKLSGLYLNSNLDWS